jgi:hypothetical protein
MMAKSTSHSSTVELSEEGAKFTPGRIYTFIYIYLHVYVIIRVETGLHISTLGLRFLESMKREAGA